MPKRTTKRVETVVYKGVTFRRYPESPHWADANYYRPNSIHIMAGIKALHVEIWQDAYGPVPEGCHIHHRDTDTSNNALDNLECLTPEEHAKFHAEHVSEELQAWRKEHLESIRHLASAWHKSEAGRAWHSVIAGMAHDNAEYKTYACEYCGQEFQSRALDTTKPRYCSNNCKSAARRKSGVDNTVSICDHCGEEFVINQYSKKRFCSRECATKTRYPDSVEETRTCPVCCGTFTARRSSDQKYCSRTCTSRSRLFNKQQ